MTFYVASLPEVIGPSYQSPSLTFLAKYYLHSSGKCARMFLTFKTHHYAQYKRFGVLRDCLLTQESHAFPMMIPSSQLRNGNSTVRVVIASRCAISDSSWAVPSVQIERDTESVRSAMALHMCGFVAAEKYNLLSTKYAQAIHSLGTTDAHSPAYSRKYRSPSGYTSIGKDRHIELSPSNCAREVSRCGNNMSMP